MCSTIVLQARTLLLCDLETIVLKMKIANQPKRIINMSRLLKHIKQSSQKREKKRKHYSTYLHCLQCVYNCLMLYQQIHLNVM